MKTLTQKTIKTTQKQKQCKTENEITFKTTGKKDNEPG